MRELSAVEENKALKLVEFPKGRKPIRLKWVFKLKRDPNGNILKHKARLVSKGYVHEHGADFNDVFTLVAKMETLCSLLALAAKNGWIVHHLDVKSIFINGELEKEVYVTQPVGFINKDKPNLVYKLSKAFYRLRQTPRAWNSRLEKCLKDLGLVRCPQEYVVYTRKKNENLLIVRIYVDDLIVTRK